MPNTNQTSPQPLSSRATEIARALGEGWSVVKRPLQMRDTVRIVGPEGMLLWLDEGYGSNGKPRIAISGEFPEGHGPSYDQRPEIRVGVTRPAHQIAGEIKRRLLPVYKPLLVQAQERQRVAEERKRQARALIERLAPHVGAVPSYHQPCQATIVIDASAPITVKVDTSLGRCSLLLDGLPEDAATRILDIVASLRTAPEREGTGTAVQEQGVQLTAS